ncbi:MAG: CaiB/BaiF CoA-transferase family protein [Magnetospirillum sp.]|nr:CaiB/BaiF CoA-transferase family protein [Magnetospirillum sp.]
MASSPAVPPATPPKGALSGLRILDLSRILAGPWCTQLLADLGADVIKIEKPGAGDDTRRWGPPFLRDRGGAETGESTYYLSANRNKRSVAIDIATPDGQALVRRLLGRCDALVENFKVGDLARYGLAWEQVAEDFPRLVYCSITGFGQTGPYRHRSGYDYLAQGMGGMMSLTGEPDGEPMKVPVAGADLATGMYAATAVLAALRHRDRTGRGQRIDVALLDCQVAWMSYAAQATLVSGVPPRRLGNGHPSIVPYQVFAAADAPLILAVGNDRQFVAFCVFAGRPELADDPRFASNAARVRNRADLTPIVGAIIAARPRRHWLEGLEAIGISAAPVNTLTEALDDPQVRARGMVAMVGHPLSERPVPLVGSPLVLSDTPPAIRRAPPLLGQHTDEVLSEILGLSAEDIAGLRASGAVAG